MDVKKWKKETPHVAPRLMSAQQLADYLGISVRTIYNGTHRKTEREFPIKPIRIGKLLRWDRRKVDELIDSL